MTWLSVAFIAAGLADLVRAKELEAPRWAPHIVSLVTFVVVALLTGLTGTADIGAFVALDAVVSFWILTSARTQLRGSRPVVPLVVLFGGALLALGFSGWAGPVGGPLARWLAWADLPFATTDAAHVLLVVGLALANCSTANIVVRCILVAMGAMRPELKKSATAQPEPSDTLRGGRLLGPLERLLILGLGLAGELGAAGIVVAAKGLLRFPEIQASTQAAVTGPVTPSGGKSQSFWPRGNGIDDVTEYFLIGSFVSWLVALASLALAR